MIGLPKTFRRGFRIADTRQQTHVDQCLKPIADAYDQVAPLNERMNLAADVGAHAQGLDHAGAVVVSPAESSAKGHNLEIFQGHRSINQGINVDAVGHAPCQLEAVGGFMIAVQPIAGGH